MRINLPAIVLFAASFCWALGAEAAGESARKDNPGNTFRDCPQCPEMVVIPAGSFQMGSVHGLDDEKPVRRVTISRRFAVGKYEVTFGEWDACVADGGCSHHPDDWGWGRGNHPVMNVSWEDAQDFVGWISRKTGRTYRLPSEAEWEYAARAGARTRYSWGDEIGSGHANCDGCGPRWDLEGTAPVGSFIANGFGLFDVHGNVMEWVADCWRGGTSGSEGGRTPPNRGKCGERVLRGGSWREVPWFLRSASRHSTNPDARGYVYGFRIARTL